jgi:hypothetical protein
LAINANGWPGGLENVGLGKAERRVTKTGLCGRGFDLQDEFDPSGREQVLAQRG